MLQVIPWGPLTQGKLRVYCSSTAEGTIFDYFMKATRENRATCRQSQWQEGMKIEGGGHVAMRWVKSPPPSIEYAMGGDPPLTHCPYVPADSSRAAESSMYTSCCCGLLRVFDYQK